MSKRRKSQRSRSRHRRPAAAEGAGHLRRRGRSRGSPTRPSGSPCASWCRPPRRRCGWRPPLVEEFGDRPVTLPPCCRWPWPAMTKPDGRVLHRPAAPPAVRRRLPRPRRGAALRAARPSRAARSPCRRCPAPGPRLQDILVDGPLDITMHDGFDFWLDAGAADDPTSQASLERANASIYPTVRLAAAQAAYWCRVPEKAHVRWVLPRRRGRRAGRAGPARRRRRADARRADQVRRHVPRARPAGAGLGPAARTPPPPSGRSRSPQFAKRYAEALAVTDAAGRRRAPRPPGPARPPAHPPLSPRPVAARCAGPAQAAGRSRADRAGHAARPAPAASPARSRRSRITSMPARSSCALVSMLRS